MDLNISKFRPAEITALQLQSRMEELGYEHFRMGRFEEYNLYRRYESFTGADQVITFTDLDGRLLAMKPDVTLSIAKNANPATGERKKYYYRENVYRPGRESHTFTEISQMGAECIGVTDDEAVQEMLQLALEALSLTGKDFVLQLGHMGFIKGLLDALAVPADLRPAIMECLRDRKAHRIEEFAAEGKLIRNGAELLIRVLSLSGRPAQVLSDAAAMVMNPTMQDALSELQALTEALNAGEQLRISLCMTGEMEYYNGLIMAGYGKGLPRALLKGGRYDLLAGSFTPGARALGFALYLDELDAPTAEGSGPEPLKVALPKGRLADKILGLLDSVGCGIPENYKDSRKLVFENKGAGLQFFLVKPSDVAVYVEHGAADVGIVGKDILEESRPDVYELMDTGLGKCRMCVVGPKNFKDDPARPLRVATKFVNIAKSHFASRGRAIDIIKLNGSIELAPIQGLSDVIVDIVETGTTLRENDLCLLTEFMPISARLIANKSTIQFKEEQMKALLSKLQEVIG